MRIKHLEHNVATNKQDAIAKKKQNNSRGAIIALRKAKMLETELGKLEGQQLMLMQQQQMLETGQFDQAVFEVMKLAK